MDISTGTKYHAPPPPTNSVALKALKSKQLKSLREPKSSKVFYASWVEPLVLVVVIHRVLGQPKTKIIL